MKQQLNEIKRMQQLAGIQINENLNLSEKEEQLYEIAFGVPTNVLYDLMQNGYSFWQIIAIQFLATIAALGTTVGLFASAMGISDLVKKAKIVFDYWKEGKKLNPSQVKDIVSDFEKRVNKLSGGRKKFFIGLINKLKKTNPSDKKAIVDANRELQHFAKRYSLNNKNH